MSDTPRINKLGVALFKLVQADQGHAFVSDSVELATDKEVLAMAQTALRHSEKVVEKLQRFLRDNYSRS